MSFQYFLYYNKSDKWSVG